MQKKSIKEVLEIICKKYQFILGNFYSIQNNQISCNEQEYYLGDPQMEYFQKASTKYPFFKGQAMPGRVWQSEAYEWESNIQKLDVSRYARKLLAIEFNVKTCVALACKDEKNQVYGVIEFYLYDEKEEDQDIIKDIYSIING